MRLFIALDIDDSIRERIARFLDGVSAFAPDVRWIRPESLHITLKFIGEKPADTVDAIKAALSRVHGDVIQITFSNFGFFPSPKAPRVFWIGISAGPQLKALASAVDNAMFQLGIPREDHEFSPHLTLARGGKSGAPQRRKGDRQDSKFTRLQAQLDTMPPLQFGTMMSHDFFLYESKLSPAGSKYTKLERFALK